MNVIFTRGLIASGKSTWAKQFVKDNPSYKRVNRDEIRHMIDNYSYKSEEIVTEIEKNIIMTLIKHKKNIVIDAQHLNRNYIEEWKKLIDEHTNALELPVTYEIKTFPITLEEAIARDNKREFKIGESVIRKTWKKYERELLDMVEKSKFEVQQVIKYNPSLPDCIICDIDGTLAIKGDRSPYDFSKVKEDKVNEPIKKLIWTILKSYGFDRDKFKVFVFSGRDDICYKDTYNWLKENNVPFVDIVMRKTGDKRKDSVVKKEMFETHIRNKYNCLYVIDDRKQVVDMWRELGLTCLDVAGNNW